MDKYKVILFVCVWNNPKFTGITMGFKLAFYIQAHEGNTSSVAVRKEKKKKNQTL